MWVTHSKPIHKDKAVCAVLGSKPQLVRFPWQITGKQAACFVGWGNKPSTQKSRQWAKKKNLEYHQLEDGFLSFLAHPALDSTRLSLIHDKQGVYYDAREPSDLSELLKTLQLTDTQERRIKRILKQLAEHGISKYNHVKDAPNEAIKALDQQAIVLIDQTAGDASIEGALAGEQQFVRMLESAIQDNQGKTLYLKVHPDVLLGKKQGVLFPLIKQYPEITVLPDGISPKQLFSITKKLYTVSSQMGFEALWRGIDVHCFGMPFYAGYGLTTDYIQPIAPRPSLTLETLAHGALLDYCHYIHPESHGLCSLEALLPFFIDHKKHQAQATINTLYAVDFSFWKRLFLPYWLNPMAERVVYCSLNKALKQAKHDDTLLLWGNNAPDIAHNHVIRLEDGFIRSKGLGIDLTPPLSLVFDHKGIYFDATKPSTIEQMLERKDVTEAQQVRAEKLIALIQANRISKYNLSTQNTNPLINLSSDKKKILVIGQVDNDASIRFGVLDDTTVFGMLKAVRKDNPDACIIYRPHPDVLTGERQGLLPEDAKPFADVIDTDGCIHDALDVADEVHVLTSLVGFEALLKNKFVYCHGSPFYSGFGLTIDKTVIKRRTRKRTLSEMTYLALIEYPRYLHPLSQKPSQVEAIINLLASDKGEVSRGVGYARRLKQKCLLLSQLTLSRLFKR